MFSFSVSPAIKYTIVSSREHPGVRHFDSEKVMKSRWISILIFRANCPIRSPFLLLVIYEPEQWTHLDISYISGVVDNLYGLNTGSGTF